MKWMTVAMLAAGLLIGCNNNKKDTTKSTAWNSGGTTTDIPVAAAPQQFTPAAQQPVVYDSNASQQPAIDDSAAYASTADVAPVASGSSHVRTRSQVSAASGSSSAGGTKYKIKKGDSLWSIAQSHYGNGGKWKTIAAANPGLNPNKIIAGQTITLP